jgi:phosphonate metabolism protein (transferase hexapeptide repeat family)
MKYIESFNIPETFVLKDEPKIEDTAIIEKSTFGAYTYIGHYTKILESSFGDYSYIMEHGDVAHTTIGKFCSIASMVRINPGNHPVWRVTSHHLTYRKRMYELSKNDDLEFFEWRKSNKVIIGHDVWIGHKATIMPGRKIGNGAIIGCGAVVTKDIPPYAVAVGVPAQIIKMRFEESIINELEESEWWNWSYDKIKKNFSMLLDINRFIKFLKNDK